MVARSLCDKQWANLAVISDVPTQPDHMLRPINGPVVWKILKTLQPQEVPLLHKYNFSAFLKRSLNMCSWLKFIFQQCSLYGISFLYLCNNMVLLLSHCHLLSAAFHFCILWHSVKKFLIYLLLYLPKYFCSWATEGKTGSTLQFIIKLPLFKIRSCVPMIKSQTNHITEWIFLKTETNYECPSFQHQWAG